VTILVTGGCGFIGSNFVLDWVAAYDEPIVNIDKLTYAGNPANLSSLEQSHRYRFIGAGIEDGATVATALRDHKVRAIVNFAAETHVDRSIEGPEAFVQTNVVGTLRLLEASRDYWASLPSPEKEDFRFLQVSTDEVYGTLGPAQPAFTEKTPFAPNSPYAASKASSDHLVRSYHKTFGLPVLTNNCSNTYGPRQFPEKLIPLTIHNALAGKPLPIYGDGKQIRDWLYVGDTCSAIRRVLEAGSASETYNVGGNNERQNIDVVRRICALLDRERPKADGSSYEDQITYVKDRPGHDRRYAIDASKIKRDLGWFPSETFESSIEKTVSWYLENQAWVEGVTSGAYRHWIARQYA
jgi:dTDP-glucose 4,6-dehydratase